MDCIDLERDSSVSPQKRIDRSDSDDSPVKSKSNRRRGLAARLKTNKTLEIKEVSDHATVYSTKVSKLFGSFEDTSGSLSVNSMMKQESFKKKQAETSVVEGNTQDGVIPLQNGDDICEGDHDVIPLELEDDEDFPSTPKMAKTTAYLVKSPTPPPPPSPPTGLAIQHKKKRMSKALKNAIRNICDAKEHLITEERVRGPDDQEVVCLEDDNGEDTLTVRIKYGSKTYRYPMKKGELFKRVIMEVASKLDVNSNKILFLLNDRTVHSHDSPKSLGLQVADILYCHVSKEDRSILDDSSCTFELTDSIQLFVQSKMSKHKEEYTISKNQPLDAILRKYSIKTNTDITKLRFQFDGEDLSVDDTPNDLDLEDGYCLDIIHLT
ncbi:NFATC2-interacting protein-like [Mytilus californianus]|uniref:NFATC2-interacting protein-like n=1 Tax=Mytilus californianus TaxID=6549 RepID=UPI0022457FC8|nr:NFATC2-interacting protein-like [Mytilus californianus]